jgi:hypothetical protein
MMEWLRDVSMTRKQIRRNRRDRYTEFAGFLRGRIEAVTPTPYRAWSMQRDQAPADRWRIDDQTGRVASSQSPHVVVAWTLRKNEYSAQCVFCPVAGGIELHIKMQEAVIVSQHCRGPEHAAFVSDTWYAALTGRGWH